VTVHILKGEHATKCFADVRFGPVIIHGFAVIESKKGGMFVAPPSRLKDDKSYPYATVDQEWIAPLSKEVLRVYEQELKRAK
jgi:DNA-binding cell septation regulator SpoVG